MESCFDFGDAIVDQLRFELDVGDGKWNRMAETVGTKKATVNPSSGYIWYIHIILIPWSFSSSSPHPYRPCPNPLFHFSLPSSSLDHPVILQLS